MKKFYQSKTFWVGALEVLSGILLLVANFLTAGDYATPAIVLLVNGVVMIVLRKLTNTGIA